jgi:propane monooxygenase small subunit
MTTSEERGFASTWEQRPTQVQRSVPRPVFTDAEAGAKVFPDSTERRFNYYVPAGRKQTHYEDVTVEVQPDPRHYLSQGWLYGFSDGRGGYPLDWTALKAWGSDRPEPKRFPGSGGKGYDWPALGWHEFRDPNEEWELTLYRYNANVVRQLSQNIDNARQAKAFDRWPRSWVRFVERNIGAWMHVDHGLGLYLYANAQRRAPTNMHNNAIAVNSTHRIRAAQDLALYNLTLSEVIDGFNGTAHLETWNEDPAWQGVREVAEQLTGIDDWCEAIFAANIVFEPLVGELFRSHLVMHAAPRNGDFVTPTIVGVEEYDYAEKDLRYTKVMFELLTSDREFAGFNKSLMDSWLAFWVPRAIRAARTLQPLWSQPEVKPGRFEDGLNAAKSRFSGIVTDLGLAVPKELAEPGAVSALSGGAASSSGRNAPSLKSPRGEALDRSLKRQQHRLQVGSAEIAELETPRSLIAAIADRARSESDGLVTLIAVRRVWPKTPVPRGSRAALRAWRGDTGDPTQRAANALSKHGFSREPDASGGDFVPLPYAGAVLVRAIPERAMVAADLLEEDFFISPDVTLRAPAPPPHPAEEDRIRWDLLADEEIRWPEDSGIEAAHEAGYRGRGVVIGVFDTGCDADHAEFVNRTVDFVYVPLKEKGVVRPVRGFATEWHGTHVTAIAAGRRRGVAPEATLLTASIMESESRETTLRRLTTAINWFQSRLESGELANAPAVLNLSLGFRPESLTSLGAQDALAVVRGLLANLILSSGALIVAAVGNDGPTAGPRAPAYFPGILSTGAVSFDGTPAPFSSGGPGPRPFQTIRTPHLAGYGVEVMSAMERDVAGTSWWVRDSGTSMAAPYVTGVAALVAERTRLQGPDLADHLMNTALVLDHSPDRVGSGLARVF